MEKKINITNGIPWYTKWIPKYTRKKGQLMIYKYEDYDRVIKNGK